ERKYENSGGRIDPECRHLDGPERDAADQRHVANARYQHRQHAAEGPGGDEYLSAAAPAQRARQVDQAGDTEDYRNVEREIAGRRSFAFAPIEPQPRAVENHDGA